MAPSDGNLLRIPLAGLLAWILPGLGHIYLGLRRQGMIHLVVIGATFWGGVALGGVQNTVKPKERTAWFMAQLSTGVFAGAALGWSRALEGSTPAYTRTTEDVAIVYTGVAGLLNLLVILDALVRAELSLQGAPIVAAGRASKGAT
jgi:hypothetical protein